MNEKHPFDPTQEQQEYFERSGCANIIVCCILIFFIIVVLGIVSLFGK